jgi:hypothetical protein
MRIGHKYKSGLTVELVNLAPESPTVLVFEVVIVFYSFIIVSALMPIMRSYLQLVYPVLKAPGAICT